MSKKICRFLTTLSLVPLLQLRHAFLQAQYLNNKGIITMKNKFREAIITAVFALTIGMLPLPGPTVPTPYPPEPPATEDGEEPGGTPGCEPQNDGPDFAQVKA